MSGDKCRLYTVERNGKSLKLKPRQLTTQILSKLYNAFPETIVLVPDDGYIETPDDYGKFVDVDDFAIWTVAGDSVRPTPLGAPDAINVASCSTTFGASPAPMGLPHVY